MNPAKLALPAALVTSTSPLAPAPTVAVMLVLLTTVNALAATPPNVTVVVPRRLVPVMVTVAPVFWEVGVKEVMVGGLTKTNPLLETVPPSAVTDRFPVLPVSTTAVMLVALLTVKEAAGVAPNLTAVTLLKLVPVIATEVPSNANAGVKEAIVGGGRYVNPASVPVPCGLVTEIFPDAPAPTTALIEVALLTVKDAALVAPNFTAVMPVKSVPVMVTVSPDLAVCGVNEATTGGGK